MKLLNKTFLAFAAVAVAFSCNKPEPNPGGDTPSDGSEVEKTFTASAENIQTKLAVSEAGAISFSEGDEITVFDGKSAKKFTSSVAGKFTGKAVKADTYYALYPFTEGATNNGDAITASIPDQQTITSSAVADGANLAIAKTTDETLAFKNVGAYIAIKVHNSDIATITVATPATTERLTGRARIAYNNGDPSAAIITGQNVITLEGAFANGATYYAVAFPCKVSAITVTATNKIGLSASRTVENPTLVRNSALVMDLNFTDADWDLEVTDGQSYVFTNREDFLAFASISPSKKENVKDLTIRCADITAEDLAKLQNRVASVTGILTLDGVGATTLEGLVDVIPCKGSIILTGCSNLENLALSGYDKIGGDLTIENCPKANLSSLSGITEVAGAIKISGVNTEFTGAALAALKKIAGNFEVSSCSSLASLEGLGINEINGDLIIRDNKSLATLAGIANIGAIKGNVVILDNGNIPTVSTDTAVGFCIVREFYNTGVVVSSATIQIGTTASPINFSTLANCSGVSPDQPQDYVIRGVTQMDNFINGAKAEREIVNNLTILGGDVTAEQLSQLKNRVAKVLGTFTLDGVCNNDKNQTIETEAIFKNESVNGLNAIECLGSVVVKNISCGWNPNGYLGFETVHGDLIVDNCPKMNIGGNGWTPFSKIREVEGSVRLCNGEQFIAGDALFPALLKVDGDFEISNWNSFWQLKGMIIREIGGSLIIQECHLFWMLDGLDKLETIGGDVIIWNNNGGNANVPVYNTDWQVGYCMIKDLYLAGGISPNANFKLGDSVNGDININEINGCEQGPTESDPDDDTNESYPGNGENVGGWY